MKIVEIEKVLETGDVVVSRTNFRWNYPLGYLSAIIRFFAKTEYNHAALVVFNWGKPFTNEAIGNGVVAHPFGNRLKGKKIKVLRLYDPDSEQVIAMKANSKVGVAKYDVIGLIYQAIYLTTGKWFGKTEEASEKRMYCFEYVAWVYEYIFTEYWRVTPLEVIDSKYFYTVLVTTVE